MKFRELFSYFTKFEWCLWLGSLAAILMLYFVGSQQDVITLIASLIGATSLIFVSKGNVAGQFLIIAFSLLYAMVSWKFRYYGEMITYLGMTTPIAIVTAVVWLRHPYEEGKSEVEVAGLNGRKTALLFVLAAIVTLVFYFILKFFDTANLGISTLSVTTSFLAAGLMFLRSPHYATGYAANDLVLIGMWILATLEDRSYLPMVLCFCIFFVNDLYGFINWRRMQNRQQRKINDEKDAESWYSG